ncbi:HNH endonuclease [Brucella sp. 21LCYQ03]|nr:HNH endonuclease [Brucella sp. 21LCYQ03]
MTTTSPEPFSELVALPVNKAKLLNNTRCPYCAIELDVRSRTKEHVIGRRFVPKGKLNGQWNLILYACEPCNSRKANLEDDISAITLQPDMWGISHHGENVVIEEARRKALNSLSRRTRRRVGDSHEQLNVEAPVFPGMTAKFNFTAPPQIDQERGFELARLQMLGLYYMQTYKVEERRGHCWPGGFHPLKFVTQRDWGNVTMRAFMKEIHAWDLRLHLVTADGFFKAMTRLHPAGDLWSWAVEWNYSTRLVGFFGDRERAEAIVRTWPAETRKVILDRPGESLHYSSEIPLHDDDDTLFDPAVVEAPLR